MPEELGKLEKPAVSEFQKGRKLLYVPLVFSGKEAPAEFQEKYSRYWNQVETQAQRPGAEIGDDSARLPRVYLCRRR